MTIIEEHRSKVRAGENTFSIEVTALPGGDRPDRLVVHVGAAGPQGELVADGQIEVAAGAAATLGAVLSETLRHHASMGETRPRRPPWNPPSGRGRPWTPELRRRVGTPVDRR